MANWNLPTATSGYLDFVTQMNSKFVDAGTLNYGSPTNLPANAFRYNRTSNIFEEWDLTTWNPKVIGLTGGGTGSNTAAGARTALGIGSMGTQNSNAVAISGGTITGVSLDGGAVNTGIVALARGGTGASLSLGAPGTVLGVPPGLSSVMFMDGQNITSLYAGALVAGTIPDARLSTNVPLLNKANSWTGGNTFNAIAFLSGPTISMASPQINFYDTGATTDQHYSRIITNGQTVYIQNVNDAYTSANTILAITPSGLVVGNTGELAIYAVGSQITNINGTNIDRGTINPNRLGSNAPNSSLFLRGDGVWATPSGGAGTPIPSGLIAIFDTGCPVGWTRFSGLDNRFPLGSTSMGATGGTSQHQHGMNFWTSSNGSHAHSFSGSVSGQTSAADNQYAGVVPSGGTDASRQAHTHTYSANFSGSTGGVSDHSHNVNGATDNVDILPPWYAVVWCRKD